MKSIFNSPLLCSSSGVEIPQLHQTKLIPCDEDEAYASPSNCENETSKQNLYVFTTELAVCNDKHGCPSQENLKEGEASPFIDPNKCVMAEYIEEDLKQIDINFNADDCTQGSDNSKCSFGYEKPKRKTLHIRADSPAPVLDMTPSKIKGGDLEDRDNTTCAWSDSEGSSIPAFIYIRRDIPPAVPDDEALGQQYSSHGRIMEGSSPGTGFFLKGLRMFTFGGFGKNVKVHLDDDASEAFKQTLVEL